MTLNFGSTLFPSRSEYTKSYDFKDLIQGQGFVQFFAHSGRQGTDTLKRSLITQAEETEEIIITKTTTEDITEDITFSQVDLDLEVGISQVVGGVAYARVPWKIYLDGDYSGAQIKSKCKLTLKRIRNSITKIIGTAETETFETTTGQFSDVTLEKTSIFSIVCENTPIAKGDILRLSIEGTMGAEDNISSLTYYLYLDPLDTLKETTSISNSSTNGNTTTTVYSSTYDSKLFNIIIPFKLDL